MSEDARQTLGAIWTAFEPFTFPGMEWRHGDTVTLTLKISDIQRARAAHKALWQAALASPVRVPGDMVLVERLLMRQVRAKLAMLKAQVPDPDRHGGVPYEELATALDNTVLAAAPERDNG